MLRNHLYLALAAILVAAPVAAQASELTRRLTIRYPGQDDKKRHHDWRRHDHWSDHRRHR